MIKINKIDVNNINFFNLLKLNLKKNEFNLKTENYVKNIIYNIKKFKDKALFFFIKKFENKEFIKKEDIKISKKYLEECFLKLNKKEKFLLENSKKRIEIFHEEQKINLIKNWEIKEKNGSKIGQKLSNIKKIGLYIPGGTAAYASSVFMNVIPAKLANIREIFITMPHSDNILPYAAAFLCKPTEIFSIGGAHAIAALAYGTKIIPKVDKICGPGNIYVTIAKKLLYGEVGIDMIAGPSEIAIICDNTVSPDILSIDLFSQAEHDKKSQTILITEDSDLIYKVENCINKLLPFMYRKNIIEEVLKNNTFFIKVNNLKEACSIINYISPEHLIISSENFLNLFKYVKNFGSIFIGKYSSESFGDYTAGVNHILPTNQTANFTSSMGIDNFYKKSNFLYLNKLGFNKLFNITKHFSEKENLFCHLESLNFRKNF